MGLIQKYDQFARVQRCSSSTNRVYRFHIKKFLQYCEGKPTQDKIMPYLDSLAKYKPSSLNIAKYSIIYFYRNILNEKINIDIPDIKRERLLPKVIDREIIINMINITKNLKHKILIELLYSSGLRVGEIIKVKWNDLDYKRKLIFVKGKGNKERWAKLSDCVITKLKEYHNKRDNKNSEYVFDSMYFPTTHITVKTVQNILKNKVKKLDLNIRITPHMMRHSYATHSLENGIDSRFIQQLLGHSDIRTTEKYLQVTKTNLTDIPSPMDAIAENVV